MKEFKYTIIRINFDMYLIPKHLHTDEVRQAVHKIKENYPPYISLTYKEIQALLTAINSEETIIFK